MKQSRTLVAVVGLVAVGVCIGAAYVSARPAGKKEVAPLRAGYVSASDMMLKWTKWQKATAEMQSRRQQAGIELTGYRATLERKKGAAATAAGEDKTRLDREVVEAQRTYEDAERNARTEIDRDSAKILGEFYKRCQAEVATMAKEMNLDVVYFCPITPHAIADKALAMPQMELFFRPPALMPVYLKDGVDLTSDLLDRLNKAE